MSKILLVDDSEIARVKMGRLLSADTEMDFQFAVDGQDALEKLSAVRPRLVVTDMVMPRLDGLTLVKELHEKSPSLPVVLVTDSGNEEIATKALRLGAASYVPKRLIDEYLLETVQQLLSVTNEKYDHRRLLDNLTRSEFTVSLANDMTLVAPFITYLQESLVRMEICDETDQMRVGVALDEALVNAIYHGNLEVSSKLREGDGSAYYALIKERLGEAPYNDRKVTIDVRITNKEVRVIIADEGPGFDPASLPDPTASENLDNVSGRGVTLMRMFMDEVSYSESGKCVTLVKRKS